jgi:hypothetical protein
LEEPTRPVLTANVLVIPRSALTGGANIIAKIVTEGGFANTAEQDPRAENVGVHHVASTTASSPNVPIAVAPVCALTGSSKPIAGSVEEPRGACITGIAITAVSAVAAKFVHTPCIRVHADFAMVLEYVLTTSRVDNVLSATREER